MNHYVCGIVLCKRPTTWVLLIHKKRPTQQAGRFNFPGGSIKPFETSRVAMSRELFEETGLHIDPVMWKPVANMIGKDYMVNFGVTWLDDRAFSKAHSKTDEWVREVMIEQVSHQPVVPDLAMILAIALDESNVLKPVILSAP